MAERIPLRLISVSGIPTIGEFQAGDVVAIANGGTGASSLGQLATSLSAYAGAFGIAVSSLADTLIDPFGFVVPAPVVNNALIWNGSYWVAGAQPLSSLSDVASLDPSAGSMLIYEDVASGYVPRGIKVDDLINVNASAAADGDVLRYSSFLERWITDPLMKTDLSITPYRKGNIIVADGSSYTDLGKGTNGQVLTASAGASLGVYWDDVDHGLLTGLEDDDHPQYVLSATNQALSSLVTSVEGSTVSLSSYIAANEAMWSADADVSTLSGLGDTNISSVEVQQQLVWDGTQWINDFNDITFLRVYNDTGVDIAKGKAVHITGAHNQNVATVALARADSPSTMPAIGITYDLITAGAEGLVVSYGRANGVAAPSPTFTEGNTVYVSPTTAGEFTETRPTAGNHLVQNIGVVMSTHATNGTLKVTGIGRSNDIDNQTRETIQYVNGTTVMPAINSNYSGLTEWVEGSGSMSSWDLPPSTNASSNIREYAPDPFNGSSIVWKAYDDGPGDMQPWEGGFYPESGTTLSIDTSKDHRYSIFVKQHANKDGTFYFGPSNQSTPQWAVLNQISGAHSTNAYFKANEDNPEVDEWYLWVGFINASGTPTGSQNYPDFAGIYSMDGVRQTENFTEWTFSSTAVYQHLRVIYYADGTNDGAIGASFWHPRIDALDGNEPSIKDLLKLYTTQHGQLAGLGDDDHTQYALVDGTRNLQTQTISDTYTGSVGDTSIGYGVETSGNLVNKAGNYLLFSATTGYQFRKQGSTTYTDTDFPQSCRDWDSTYNTVLNSSSTWGGGGTSVQTPIVSGQVYHYRESFANSINNRDTEFGTFWVAGGNGVNVDIDDYNFDARSSIAATLNSAGDRWTYWPMGNFLRTVNAADGDEMLLEARVYLTDSLATGGGISIGFVDWDGNNAIAYNTAPPSDETYSEDHVNMHFDIAHTNVQTAQLDSGGGSTPTVTDLGASYPMSDYVDVWFRPAVHMKYNAISTNWDVQFYINGTAVGSPYSHSLTGSILPFIGSYYGTGAANTFQFRVDWFDVQFQIGNDASEAYLDMTTL